MRLRAISRSVLDAPGQPSAFRTAPGQGINIARNTWHGVLTPLHAPGLFAVIDRIGPTPNLQEFWLPTADIIVSPITTVKNDGISPTLQPTGEQ